MTQKITIETLAPEQLRELVIHQSQCEDLMALLNNTLLTELDKLTHKQGFVSCEAVREKLNGWSAAVNELIEARDVEASRIIDTDLKTYN